MCVLFPHAKIFIFISAYKVMQKLEKERVKMDILVEVKATGVCVCGVVWCMCVVRLCVMRVLCDACVCYVSFRYELDV